MLNKVIIMGRLTADPEFRQTQSGIPVCTFTVAVDRNYSKDPAEKKADFLRITAWRSTAEFISRYFVKGKPILVEGRLQNDDYTDNNGVKHYSYNIVADSVSFTLSDNTQSQYRSSQQQPMYDGGQQYSAPAYQNNNGYGAAPAYNANANSGYRSQYNTAPQSPPLYQAQPAPPQFSAPSAPAPQQEQPAFGELSDFEEVISDGELPF